MGLNMDPNRVSNTHINVFLPSCQSWVFDWASKVAIISLHGSKTFEMTNVNASIQAANEHTPFENNMTNTLL